MTKHFNFRFAQSKQLTIHEAAKNQEAMVRKDADKASKLISGQIIWANTVHKHGLSSEFFTCSAQLFPVMFPDSEIAKDWGSHKKGMKKTKGDYFGCYGIHPFLKEELVNILRKSFFSLNFDESTVLKSSQMDINVSYWNEGKVNKRNLTTIAMEAGTSAEEIVDAVLLELDKNFIRKENLISVSTDGCSTMLGKDNGVQARLRQEIPHIPDFGGCPAHDCSNVLKSTLLKLHPDMLKIYHALPTYLASQSMHRWRDYVDFCSENGFDIKNPPKMIEVRFRVVPSIAAWMERDDRAIYGYLSQLVKDVKTGVNKDPTETEMTLLEKYMGNYVEVRLTNKFLLDVTAPLMKFLDTFEKNEVKVHVRFEKIVSLIYDFASKYLKNAGLDDDEDTITAKKLLKIKFTDEDLQLSNKDIFLGPSVDSFLEEMKLKRDSPLIASWLARVRLFYVEASEKLNKYFSASLKSKTMQFLSVLSPRAAKSFSLEELQRRWRYLAEKFPTVIKTHEISRMLGEVRLLKNLDVEDRIGPEEFFRDLMDELDDDGDPVFELVSKLGQALLTIYNSSSCVERDFTLQNFLTSDKRKNRTSQLRLQARLNMMSNVHSLRKYCGKCEEKRLKKKSEREAVLLNDSQEESEESDDDDDKDVEGDQKSKKADGVKHCHCFLFRPSEEMVTSMSNGQPYRRSKDDMMLKREKKKADEVLKDARKFQDDKRRKNDLMFELQHLKKKVEVDKRKAVEEKSAVKRKGSEDKQKNSADEKTREKLKKRKEKEEKLKAKKARLELIL